MGPRELVIVTQEVEDDEGFKCPPFLPRMRRELARYGAQVCSDAFKRIPQFALRQVAKSVCQVKDNEAGPVDAPASFAIDQPDVRRGGAYATRRVSLGHG